MPITDFLLARIAEDDAHGGEFRLAECEAKRRIVKRAESVNAASAAARHTGMFERVWELEWVCRLLALPYADHPDYRPEWRP